MKFINKNQFWILISIILIPLIVSCSPTEVINEGNTNEINNRVESIPMNFVHIPGSKFVMGSSDNELLARSDEFPQHEVVLSSFFIMKREVTNFEYNACMVEGVCTSPLIEKKGPTSLFNDPDYANWPVVGVDWYQAQTYCEWIDGRLPTEAEWEKAARGKDGFLYPWGEEEITCDLANGKGCVEKADTTRVLSFPDGESPFGLADVAGNVREWTADWYAPNAYTENVLLNPTGPITGEQKVTKGGSFDDAPENLRPAARLPMDPEEQNPLVGFRCVPIGESMAPICQPTYRTFCDDPGVLRIPGDDPCIPEEQQTDCGGTSIANFGCPDGETVTVAFSTPTTGNVDVTIGADGFDCEAGDGLIYCNGPAQKMGASVAVTVCSIPVDENKTEAPDTVSAEMNISNIMLSGYFNSIITNLSNNNVQNQYGFCPAGYQYDIETNSCVRDLPTPCPDGWYMVDKGLEDRDEMVILCVPENESSCPEGTQFDEGLIGCLPIDPLIGCPTGFQSGISGDRCAPPIRRTAPCLPGYWMDAELGCCVPLEEECEINAYLDTRVDECLGLEYGGCPVCTSWDAYEGCISVPGCEPGETDTSEKINKEFGSINKTCLPQDTGLDGICDPPDSDGECGEDYFLTRDPESGEMVCRPVFGPGSDCPRGYIVDPRTECCVPLKDPCLDVGDGETNIGAPGGEDNPFYDVQYGAVNPFESVLFGDASFNPYGSDCENNYDDDPYCPPGMYQNNDGGCEYESGGLIPVCPDGCMQDYENPLLCRCEKYDEFSCPEGDCWLMDSEMATCTWICGGDDVQDLCDDDQVWVPELELCVPRGDDCCAPGYDYSVEYEDCMPIIQHPIGQISESSDIQTPSPTVCTDGYEWVDGQCMLISRRGSERCCWTTVVTVPKCVGPCKVGKVLNPTTGICEEPKKESNQSGNPCAGCGITQCNDIAHPCYGGPCCP